MPQPRLLCFGLGYTATRLARSMAARGFSICGTSRDPDAKRALLDPSEATAWEIVRFDDQTDPRQVEAMLEGATHLLHSIMPDERGDPLLVHHSEAIRRALDTDSKWLGYLSTTGVYGDHRGRWVDEDTPRRPTRARTHRRLLAEDAWMTLGATVFRLAGIYGPGRSALERVESGRARRVLAPKLFNRIHVDDIVTTLEASIDTGQVVAGRAYNLADGQPATSAAVLTFAAQLLEREAPPEVGFKQAQADMSPIARSFWADAALVRNDRIRGELGVELAYPDFRAGLRACLAARSP